MNRAATIGPFQVTATEYTHLTRLLDTALTEPSVVAALNQSWGLCPRHAWAFAALEAERKNGIVYVTTAVHARLLSRAATVTVRHGLLRGSALRHHLTAHGPCLTCEYLERAADDHHDSSPSIEQAAHFIGLLALAEPALAAVACPVCLDGDGIVCRPHLLAGVISARSLSSALRDLAQRLEALRDSLLADVHPLDHDQATTWIEGLGWLAGWDFARLLPAVTAHAMERRREGNGKPPDWLLER